MESLKITLAYPVCYFDRHGYFIAATGKLLAAKTTIHLGLPDKVFHEYRYHEAAPFMLDDHQYYVIIEDIGIPGLLERLKRLPYMPNLSIVT
jgi:hypothetical protein